MEPTNDRSRALSAARAHLDRGFRFEQAGSHERALDAYRDALAARPTPVERAEAHLRTARVYRGLSDWERSREESTLAVKLANEIGADDLAAEAMNVEMGALQIRGFIDEAETVGLEALRRAKTARVRGITLQNLGRGAAERRDFAASDKYFQESVDAFRAANYDLGLAVALTNAAKSALDRGDAARALQIGDEAITLTRRVNALTVLLTAVQNQAAAFVAIGELDAAESLLTEALGHFTSARDLIRQAECLEIMGQMSESRADDRETARRCYKRARELAVEAGDHPLIERLQKRLELSA
jgi:tetratricopeptide (TPR) repeat protein